MPCRIVVLSDGRRPQTIERCFRFLRERGGASFDVFQGPGGGHGADLWKLLGAHKTEEDLLVLEDDIIPCRNALRYMSAFALPADVAFVSFFDMRHLVGMYPQLLWIQPEAHDGRGPWGTQAFKVSGAWARRFAEAPSMTKGDIAMSKAVLGTGFGIGIHAPSLVQHDHQMQCLNFVGSDFDADLLSQ